MPRVYIFSFVGETLSLCAECPNALAVSWLKEQDEIFDSDEIKMSRDKDVFKLDIPSLKNSHTGAYTLEAVTKLGQVKTLQFNVAVEGYFIIYSSLARHFLL